MSKEFTTILQFMVDDLKLSGNDLIIYAIIYGFCQDGNSSFYGSLNYLSRRTGVTKRGVVKILNRLTESGIICKEEETTNGIKRVKYQVGTKFLGGEQSSLGSEQSSSSSEQSSPNIKEYKRENKEHYCATDEMFQSFWESYPRKVGKSPTEKAFRKINPDETLLDTILSALDSQKQSEQWQKDGGKYIPYPATWLNQERWNDELDSSSGSGNTIESLGLNLITDEDRKAWRGMS